LVLALGGMARIHPSTLRLPSAVPPKWSRHGDEVFTQLGFVGIAPRTGKGMRSVTT